MDTHGDDLLTTAEVAVRLGPKKRPHQPATGRRRVARTRNYLTTSDLDQIEQRVNDGVLLREDMQALLCDLRQRLQRKRTNYISALPLADRFWALVEKTDECWMWTADISGSGYGRFMVQHRGLAAHRFSYELAFGPIAEGLEIDHLCRQRLCVRPDHLEAVSRKVNVHRSMSFAGINARKTHCPRGHPYDAANTRWGKDGHRHCRACDSRGPSGRARQGARK